MKTKILKYVFVVAIAMVGGINVFNAQKSEPLSDVALANVEALAQSETNTTWMCSGFWGDCYAICGACKTQVGPSNGQISGSYSCN